MRRSTQLLINVVLVAVNILGLVFASLLHWYWMVFFHVVGLFVAYAFIKDVMDELDEREEKEAR